MVSIPAGNVDVGGVSVAVAAFLMDATEVTNDSFAAFAAATGYVTDAERIGNSVVFDPSGSERAGEPHIVLEGASWKTPLGPGSDLKGRGDHPVVHVSYVDAVQFAAWRGCRLPTSAEWMHAAKGGLEGALYPWGDALRPDGVHQMNAWQGLFPTDDVGLDGYRGTAPAGTYPANGYGLHDVAGNVWEWTGVPQSGAAGAPSIAEVRGGSFRCRERAAEGYHACCGYRLDAVQTKLLDDGNDNVGFRCVRTLESR